MAQWYEPGDEISRAVDESTAVLRAAEDLESVMAVIHGADSPVEARRALKHHFGLSGRQATLLLTMPVMSFTRSEREQHQARRSSRIALLGDATGHIPALSPECLQAAPDGGARSRHRRPDSPEVRPPACVVPPSEPLNGGTMDAALKEWGTDIDAALRDMDEVIRSHSSAELAAENSWLIPVAEEAPQAAVSSAVRTQWELQSAFAPIAAPSTSLAQSAPIEPLTEPLTTGRRYSAARRPPIRPVASPGLRPIQAASVQQVSVQAPAPRADVLVLEPQRQPQPQPQPQPQRQSKAQPDVATILDEQIGELCEAMASSLSLSSPGFTWNDDLRNPHSAGSMLLDDCGVDDAAGIRTYLRQMQRTGLDRISGLMPFVDPLAPAAAAVVQVEQFEQAVAAGALTSEPGERGTWSSALWPIADRRGFGYAVCHAPGAQCGEVWGYGDGEPLQKLWDSVVDMLADLYQAINKGYAFDAAVARVVGRQLIWTNLA